MSRVNKNSKDKPEFDKPDLGPDTETEMLKLPNAEYKIGMLKMTLQIKKEYYSYDQGPILREYFNNYISLEKNSVEFIEIKYIYLN